MLLVCRRVWAVLTITRAGLARLPFSVVVISSYVVTRPTVAMCWEARSTPD